jgi:hypothetical protein
MAESEREFGKCIWRDLFSAAKFRGHDFVKSNGNLIVFKIARNWVWAFYRWGPPWGEQVADDRICWMKTKSE